MEKQMQILLDSWETDSASKNSDQFWSGFSAQPKQESKVVNLYIEVCSCANLIYIHM